MKKATTYEDILKLSEEGIIKTRKFSTYFKPIDDADEEVGCTKQFEWDEAKKEAEKIAENKEEFYRHIWTAVDVGGQDISLLNGSHLCNRLFYIVCEIPWGDGTAADKDVYIEAKW